MTPISAVVVLMIGACLVLFGCLFKNGLRSLFGMIMVMAGINLILWVILGCK